MIEGAISADCPATILQMHPRCTVVLDEAAATRLQRSDYYRWIYDNKPAWQRTWLSSKSNVSIHISKSNSSVT